MNYLFGCHEWDGLPDRFYGHDWKTICFNFKRELANAGKWKNLRRMILGMDFSNDDLFWFPDPDLVFAKDMPAKLFETMRIHKVELGQPSLSIGSICSHPHLFFQCQNEPRKVPFVEIMMPCFSYKALQRNLWTFDLNYSGFGIDYIWGKNEDCFVFDNLLVSHPSSNGYHNTARKAGLPDPNREMDEIKRLYL